MMLRPGLNQSCHRDDIARADFSNLDKIAQPPEVGIMADIIGRWYKFEQDAFEIHVLPRHC